MNIAQDATSFLEKLYLSMNKGSQFSSLSTFKGNSGPGVGFGSGFGLGNTQQKPQSGFSFGQSNTNTFGGGLGQPFGQQAFGQGVSQPQQTFGGFNTAASAQHPPQGANTQQLVSLIGDMIKRQVADTPEPQAAQPSVASVATEASALETSLSKILTNTSSASASVRLSAATRRPGIPRRACGSWTTRPTTGSVCPAHPPLAQQQPELQPSVCFRGAPESHLSQRSTSLRPSQIQQLSA